MRVEWIDKRVEGEEERRVRGRRKEKMEELE